MSVTEDRIAAIHKRVEELDQILGRYIQRTIADDSSPMDQGEMEYQADRREERKLLLQELDDLLRS